VKLLGAWDSGVHIFQMWDMDDEYVFKWISSKTLETICESAGNTPGEAIEDGVREFMRRP
jgi:hypothetical protein